MNPFTGEIMEKKALQTQMGQKDFQEHAVPVDPAALSSRRKRQLQRTGATKVGRNEPCPCGSGIKFKRCCYQKLNPPPGKSIVETIADKAVVRAHALQKARLLSMDMGSKDE